MTKPQPSPTLQLWDAQRARHQAELDATTQDDYKEPIPDTIEVHATPIENTDPRMPGGAKTVIKKALANGWEQRVTTYARGPWMHSTHWTPVSTSDTVVVRLVKVVDGKGRAAVACWRDKKFDHAFLLSTAAPSRMANSKELKEWVEE